MVVHALSAPLDSSVISSLRFDAYASSGSWTSHNTSLGLGTGNTPSIYWQANQPGSWIFRPLGGDLVEVGGGFNAEVHLAIVLDGTRNKQWGTYDFGFGVQKTPESDISALDIGALDHVHVYVDYRSQSFSLRGAEFDNLSLTVVPELESSGVGIAGFLLIGAMPLRHWLSRKQGSGADR